jgi:hypothetical protein
LKGEMADEGLLQRGQLTILGMAFHGADRLAIEADRGDDAGGARVAPACGSIDDNRAAQALGGTAAELRSGHAKDLAQEVVHGQLVANLHRAVRVAVDGQGKGGHESAPLSMLASVTGRAWNR